MAASQVLFRLQTLPQTINLPLCRSGFLCGCQRSCLAGVVVAESLDLTQTQFGSRRRWRTGGGNSPSSFLRRSSDTCRNGSAVSRENLQFLVELWCMTLRFAEVFKPRRWDSPSVSTVSFTIQTVIGASGRQCWGYHNRYSQHSLCVLHAFH